MQQIANVNVQRFYALADLLDDVPEKDFSLQSWVYRLPQEAKTRFFGLFEVRPECGFAGCAMGWAAHAKIFWDVEFSSEGHLIYMKNGKVDAIDWEACQKAMGISKNMGHFLFDKEYYNTHATTTMVADRCRRFAKKIEAIRARDRKRNARAQWLGSGYSHDTPEAIDARNKKHLVHA